MLWTKLGKKLKSNLKRAEFFFSSLNLKGTVLRHRNQTVIAVIRESENWAAIEFGRWQNMDSHLLLATLQSKTFVKLSSLSNQVIL
jgi:hypothetical protein